MKDDRLLQLGQKIRYERLKKGLSQEDLEEKSFVSRRMSRHMKMRSHWRPDWKMDMYISWKGNEYETGISIDYLSAKTNTCSSRCLCGDCVCGSDALFDAASFSERRDDDCAGGI